MKLTMTLLSSVGTTVTHEGTSHHVCIKSTMKKTFEVTVRIYINSRSESLSLLSENILQRHKCILKHHVKGVLLY